MAYKLHVSGKAHEVRRPLMGRVTTRGVSLEARKDFVFLDPGPQDDLTGYAGALLSQPLGRWMESPAVHSLPYRDHLDAGDVVLLQPSGYVRTLFKVGSPHNAIFTTDRCNSFCVMCSQPPKSVDDRDRIHEHLRLIDLIDPAPKELGITGGEPTLLGRDLIRIIEACKRKLPTTGLHMLSNGRLFRYERFARDLAAVGHPDLIVGIPVYSDIPHRHDFIVQAEGAFTQTMLGLHNLARYGVAVEIRIVIHRKTYDRLPHLAELIYRNLTFAGHVALMGLEETGFAVPNLAALWIDPVDYQSELAEAALFLAARGMNVSIYNHQLCTVPRALWQYCRRSISDWKNDYLPQCGSCSVRDRCAGFFTSSLGRRVSKHIEPLSEEEAAQLCEGQTE